ncbi:MAG: hypothetical protein NZQ09_10745, partial [Chloroflexus sp.]|nr:hypothetical protein [Chloroflexus sp.]
DTVLTQWFERARFELHTNLGPDVVLLGLLGREAFAPQPEPQPMQPVDERCVNIPAPEMGFVNPNCISAAALNETLIFFHGYGFNPGELVSVYMTRTDTGEVTPFEFTDTTVRAASEDEAFTGSVFLLLQLDLSPGLYALTIEGIQSGHKSIMFFKVI